MKRTAELEVTRTLTAQDIAVAIKDNDIPPDAVVSFEAGQDYDPVSDRPTGTTSVTAITFTWHT